jgi:O-antigen/teichoic acid export membrane protein
MPKIKSALATVYVGYFFRYIYLLILIPFYARTLGPDGYGLILAAMALGNFVWVLQNWGFSVVGARNIASIQLPELRGHEFGRHVSARLILMPLVILVGALGTFFSPMLASNPWFGVLATVNGILSGFNLGWYFQGAMQFRVSITAEVIGFIVALPMILLLVHGPDDSLWVMIALTVAGLTSTIYSYLTVSKEIRLQSGSVKEGYGLLKESGPMFVAAGASSLLATGGTYSLSILSTPAQVAFYGTAERVVTTVLGLLGPAGQVMLVWFSGMKAGGDAPEAIKQKQHLALKWVSFAGLITTIGALTVAPYILVLILGADFKPTGDVLVAFSPIFLLSAFNHAMCVYLLLPAKQDKNISFVGIVCALVGGALMFICAGIGGAQAIALSRVFTELLSACLLIFFYRKSRRY